MQFQYCFGQYCNVSLILLYCIGYCQREFIVIKRHGVSTTHLVHCNYVLILLTVLVSYHGNLDMSSTLAISLVLDEHSHNKSNNTSKSENTVSLHLHFVSSNQFVLRIHTVFQMDQVTLLSLTVSSFEFCCFRTASVYL